MLPSQGLFRSIPCPFFLAGLCERPQCCYRHCKSDIRIDRKRDAETLLEAETEETGQEVPSASTSAESSKDQLAISKDKLTGPLPATNSNSSSSGKELTSERLKTDKARKRSYDKSGNSSSDHKRRRTGSEDKSKSTNDMGNALSSSAGGVLRTCKQVLDCLPTSEKIKPTELPDIDALVREIENAGKKPTSHRHHHKHKHKKRNRHRRESETSNSKELTALTNEVRNESGPLQNSPTSQKKEAKSSPSNSNKKDKDGKEPSSNSGKEKDKTNHRHSGTSDRPKESSSGQKDHHKSYNHRKSTTSAEVHSPKKDKEKNEAISTTSTPKRDRRPSGSSSGKGSSDSSSRDPTIPSSIDISNRFNVLAESSADESAYNSDIFDADDVSVDFGFVGGSDSEDDPDVIARECLEMYKNYKPEENTKQGQSSRVKGTPTKVEEKDVDGFCVVGKKRVAHANAVSKTPASLSPNNIPKPFRAPPGTSRNLQATLFRRVEEQRKLETNSQPKNGTASPPKPSGKMRIAHVPNAAKLAQRPVFAKPGDLGKLSSAVPGQPGALTYSQTVAKGTAREAHKAVISSKPGPTILRDAIVKDCKIPLIARQQLLDKLFAEHFRIVEDHDKAVEITINKEHELATRYSLKSVYWSAGCNIITGLRKFKRLAEQGVEEAKETLGLISHTSILTGSLEAKNCSVGARKEFVMPTGHELYKALSHYTLTEEELIENGYPRPIPGVKGRVTAKPRPGEPVMTLTRRVCERCRVTYETDIYGEVKKKESCCYHPAKKFITMTKMGRSLREQSYQCCGAVESESVGCQVADCHVSKSPLPIEDQMGFVSTINREDNDLSKMGSSPWDIVGIDCEMVYTTHGSELARVTVVDVNREVLYDSVVKPLHRVLDCNTKFSGLTKETLAGATITLPEVQAILLSFLKPTSIIIGHSLESDLLTLHMCHDYVIDTSVLYPHRMGPPKKRALKNLSSEVLRKIIQDGDNGHDSAEDAQVAVELVLHKLKSDLTCRRSVESFLNSQL